MKQYKTLLSIIILVIFYGVGFFGTAFLNMDLMRSTPFILLITPLLLFASHPRFDIRFVTYIFVVFVSGFIIEWVGVETGRIFGCYFYGNNLGYKILEVPITIGVTWLVLSYCSCVIATNIFSSPYFRNTQFVIRNAQFLITFLASVLMVIVDLFLEQIAPVYDFWYWKGQQVPVQNYTAWFAFSFAFNYLFQRLHIDTGNKVAPWVYGFQLAFFAGLALL